MPARDQPPDRAAHRRRSARAGGWRGSRHRPPCPTASAATSARAHPARIDHRHPGVKADDGDMRDRVERRDDRRDAARRQQERVAAGDDDLPDLRPLRGYSRRRGRAPRRRASPPCARPARGGSRSGNRPGRRGSASAARGRDSGGRCPAPATSARRRSGRADRPGASSSSAPRGHELRRDRVGRIGRVDQLRDILGQRHRIALRDPPHLVEPLRRDQPQRNQIVGAEGQPEYPIWIELRRTILGLRRDRQPVGRL